MLHIESARSGDVSASVAGKRLHSIYDPWKEARRFLQTAIDRSSPTCVVVVGPGLGYIPALLQKQGIRTICLFLSSECASAALCKGDHHWVIADLNLTLTRSESERLRLRNFLQTVLGELGVIGLEVVSWPASIDAFPQAGDLVMKTTLEIVREANANLSTTAAFGERWLRNLCTNYLRLPPVEQPVEMPGDVVLVAAGPSLNITAPQLAEHFRKQNLPTERRPEIWAVGTALSALQTAEIQPDLVISTDAGYYALEHLSALRRGASPLPMATPLTAARGIGTYASNLWLINQNTPIEKTFYRVAQVPTISLPSNGTVAGTALELALQTRTGRIVLVGLDLSYCDIQPHARPHSFEHYLHALESRTRPLYGLYAEQAITRSQKNSEGMRVSRQLDSYKAWFQRNSFRFRNRVFQSASMPINLGVATVPDHQLGEFFFRNSKDSHKQSIPHGRRTGSQAPIHLSLTARIEHMTSFLSHVDAGIASLSTIQTPHELRNLSTSRHSIRGAEDLQLLTFLDMRGVIQALQPDEPEAFRQRLETSIQRVRSIIACQRDIISSNSRGPIQDGQ